MPPDTHSLAAPAPLAAPVDATLDGNEIGLPAEGSSPKTGTTGRGTWRSYFSMGTVPYWLVHLAAVAGVIALGWSWSGLALAIGSYYARMFFVTGAYHRYFSHRTYKTSRFFQFVLALGAMSSGQKGVLWWAGHHRHHHRYSDLPEDLHSVVQDGFWWSHMGWILSGEYDETATDRVRDLAKYPELRWLDKYHALPAVALGVLCFVIGGWHGLVWGFFVSSVLLWHGTFTINSLSHVFGSRRYETTDTSRNNLWLALITLGEGWHNNHHHYQRACNQGFRWYEIDITYYILRLLALTGLVWDVRSAPDHIVYGRKAGTK